MKTTITLPMPVAELSPNKRVHWAVRAKAVKSHRLTSRENCAHQGLVKTRTIESYQLHFVFPDKRKRDFDNFTSRCKAYLDGIGDYMDQDDSAWGMGAPTREIKPKESYVEITLNFKV